MCDERTAKENDDMLSRRGFTAIAAGAVMAVTLPQPAHALAVAETDVKVTTPEGAADCYFVHPASGKHPAVIVWPDAMGLRPAFRAMGKRLAESGYAVLVVNQFYRNGPAPLFPPGASFQDPPTREKVMALIGTLNPQTHKSDALAFIKFLDAQKAVDTKRKLGATGYCMGGAIVMRTAAAAPDRVGAGATFHGGGMATDKPDSPHLLIPTMKASFLVCIAENDDKADPKAKDTLRESFAMAGLPAEIEVYSGTMHGWCPPDSQVYNQAQAEEAWSRLLALFGKALA